MMEMAVADALATCCMILQKARREDKLPEKVCLSCISEINRCYSFKLKCENSFKTLRQLVPDALLDEANVIVSNAEVEQAHKGVQTIPEDKMCLATTCNQTKLDVEKTNRYVQTTPMCYVTCDRSTSPLIMEHCDTSRFNRVMSENALEIDGEERGSIQFIKDLRHARSVKRTRFEVETDIYKDAAEIGEHSDAIVLYSTMHEDSNGTKENEATYNQFSIFKSGNESEEKLTKSINSAGEPKQMKPETDEYWEEKVYAPHVSSVEDVVYNAADGEEPGSNNGVLVCENDSGKSEIVTKQNAVTTRSGSTAEIYKKPIIKEGLKWSHCSMTFVRAKWLAQHKLKRHGIIREDRTAVRKEKQSSTTTTTTKCKGLSGDSENSDDSDNASLNTTTTNPAPYNKTSPTILLPIDNETKPAKLVPFCYTCGARFALQRSLIYHRKQNICNKANAKIFENSEAIVLYSTMHEDSNGTNENKATYYQFSNFQSGNESEEKLTKFINSAGEPKQLKQETDEYGEEEVYAPHVSCVEDVVYNAADGEEPEGNNGFMVSENDSGKSEIVAKWTAVTTRSRSTVKVYKKPIIKEESKCSHCSMTFVSVKCLARHKLKRHGITRKDRTAVSKEKESTTTNTTTKSESLSGHSENSDDSDNASLNITTTTTVNETKRAKLLHSCDTCGAGFALQRSLNYHLNQDLCNKVTHSCNICERVFISKETLKEHKSMHLQETKCTKCDMIFGSNDELSKHMVAMHMRYLRNQCPHCKKVFTTISAFKDHLRVHSGEKPFVCDICSKGFSQKTYLKQHIMRHSKERNFKCGECSMGFVTKAELCRHKRIHTGEHPYRCVECYATFTKSSSLVKHHKRMHTGELPFACDFCSKRFACSTTLEIHQRTHTAEKPYKCCFCKKGFAQNRECIIHQLKEKILLKNRTKAQMNRCRIKPMIR
ncbi:PREDICTED: zinc finger protein 62 homolog isoform X2 [Rhagoletis zephyria]|uniref:zinc finger protein 62 homolog isoform X2 n=1 Tax=Rhagoletis zephyria TaxID=28612 RepID=UPI0008114DC4|nr:PREDICTED: zinc finger protein 62 homolog isoform X2 [Rhagoletis zephyria]